MGSVIRPDTDEGVPAALTETGKGRFLSKGYLREDPALAYLGEDETPAFVVTNETEGVQRERGGEVSSIKPGDSYRTIAVVTDQRLVVLVGDADDGDERITLPLVEVARATAEDGALVLSMGSGETWRIHAGEGEIAAVATAIQAAADTWNAVESTLATVKRTLVSATANRDRGEYEDGIADAQSAHDTLAEASDRVAELTEEWPTATLDGRIEAVRDRCVRTLADVRIGHGRSLLDRAEDHWAAEDYERAHDALDRARAEFEAVLALDADRHDRAEAIEEGLSRVETALEELRAAPLERAIEADRSAGEVDDPAAAVAASQRARRRYETTLALDADEPERRFEGDPEKIRDRIEAVTERILATARDDGAEALGASKWFHESERPQVAIEEARVARDVFAVAADVAADAGHEDAPEFEQWLADSEAALTRAIEAANGERITEEEEATEVTGGASEESAVAETAEVGITDGSAETEAENEDGWTSAKPDPESAPADAGTDQDADRTVPAEDDEQREGIAENDGGTRAEGSDGVTAAEETTAAESGSPADSASATDGDLSGPSLDDADLPDLEDEVDTEGDQEEADHPDEVGDAEDDGGAGGDGEAVVGDGAGAASQADLDVSLEIKLRALDPAGFEALARRLLDAEGLEATAAPAEAAHDLAATPRTREGDPVAVWTIHRPIAGPVDADQITEVVEVADDIDKRPVVLTSSPSTEAAVAAADEADLWLLDRSDIVTVLNSDLADVLDEIRPQP